ncbi:MAG: dephospho-CoA kinase [Planctomycetota bacterium]
MSTARQGPDFPASRVLIGVVGGIASGKSTIAGRLAELCGAGRLDADAAARRAFEQPKNARAIAREFPRAAGASGEVDRKKLAKIVFDDEKALARLEAILHPPIRQSLLRSLSRARQDVVILDAPLLQENGLAEWCDLVVYVECPARTRRARSRATRGWTENEHCAREARQFALRRKRAGADAIVRNRDSASGGAAGETTRDLKRLNRRIEKVRRAKKRK